MIATVVAPAPVVAQPRAWPAAARPRTGRRVLGLAGLVFAACVLVPQLGQAHAAVHALSRAQWAWLPLVGLSAGISYLMAAVALTGATAWPLVLRRTWAVQVAAAFTNRLAPAGLGGMATNVRYLEGVGQDRPAAITAVGLSSLAGFLVHVAIVVALVPLIGLRAPRAPFASPLPADWSLVLAAAGSVLVVAGVAQWGRPGVRRVGSWARSTAASLHVVGTSPRRAVALFAGAGGVTAAYALGLAAAVQSFGGGVGTGRIVAVYLGSAAVAAAAPTPGGLGPLETGLVVGLRGAGMATGPALGAVLVYRLVTYWLPVVPGVVLYRRLRQRAVL